MSNVFITADLHLNHQGILKHNARPWKTVEEMNNGLIDNWNRVVHRNDTVYILGDFAFSNWGYFINALRGKKILIVGSHDKMPRIYLEQFQEVRDIKYIKALGHNWVMCHTAMRVWEKSHYCSIHLYAHSHGRLNTQNLSFDTGVDTEINCYSPQPLEVYVNRAQIRYDQMVADGRVYKDQHSGKELLYSDDLAWALKKIREGGDQEKIIGRFV